MAKELDRLAQSLGWKNGFKYELPRSFSVERPKEILEAADIPSFRYLNKETRTGKTYRVK